MFDWITGTIDQLGYAGLVLLMFAENIFPPIPSELVMPLAGFLAAQGKLTGWGVVAAGTLGTVLGALPWYWAGRAFRARRLKRLAARHGRWLTLHPSDVDRAQAWFTRHGRMAVFWGRMVPGIRTLISVPVGIARMPMLPFLAWTAGGSLLWNLGLTAAGYLLESQYERVAGWVDPVSTVIVVALVAVYVWRVVTYRAEEVPAEATEDV